VVSSAATQAYVATTTAVATAGAAIANGARAVINATTQAAVSIDTLKAGGGSIKVASDFVQGLTSNARVPNTALAHFAHLIWPTLYITDGLTC
jgi:ribulose kinase